MTQHSVGHGLDVAPHPSDEAGVCPRCGHPMSRHDAIAARYCQATHPTDPGRTCICRPAAT